MTFFFWLTTRFFKSLFRLFYRLRVYGVKQIYKGGAIIAPNHVSFYDPPIICAAWPEETHYLARDTLFKKPLLRSFITRLNAHPVSGSAQDLNSFKIIGNLLQQKKKVVIFPEGERSWDGAFQPIKTGVAMLALRSKSAIIPAYIHGAFEVWPRTQKSPKPWGEIACVFGSPILMNPYLTMNKKEAQAAITVRLQESIAQLRDWYLEGAIGNPP